MKNFHLDQEERKINRDIARGKYIPVKDLEAEKAKLQRIAKEHREYIERTSISIRVPFQDLEKLKVLASKEGIPYQTMINSVLHKFVEQAG